MIKSTNIIAEKQLYHFITSNIKFDIITKGVSRTSSHQDQCMSLSFDSKELVN